jgi:hypothetical protein
MSYRSNASPRGALLLALVAGSALLACASGPIALSSAQAATLPTLTLSLNASSITVGGTLQSGGVNVVSTATALKEPASTLFLLKPGVSVAEFYAYLNTDKTGDPNTASKYGAIVFDDEDAPGKTSEAQTTLQPGQYVALNTEGEKSSKWLRASFTVTASASPAVLPTPQATVRSIEFAFTGPATLHDGELVRFENEGYVVHMDLAFPVKSHQAAKKLVKALLAGKEKQSEKLVAGPPANFAGPLSSGAYQQETITAKPGWYVQVCFMETQDRRNHTRLGMERIIKIAK